MATNYYSILGVPQSASEADIRRRFKALARERHPDRFQGPDKERAEAEFQALTEAFNVLTNPERRRRHDQEVARPQRPRPTGTATPPEAPPGQPDPAELLRAYMSRGVSAYKSGDYLAAAKAFDEATKADPGNAQAWHHLALALSRDERWFRRAAAAISKAVELEPMKASYLKLAGKIHARIGETEDAVRHYKAALSWGGEDSGVDEALAELEGEKKGRLGFFGKG